MSEKIVAIAKKLKGKKAKAVKLTEEPADTKAKPLPKDVQKGLEEHFGIKLNKVRVNFGGNAETICKGLKANAFSQGTNIYVKKSGDAGNKELLAHELTHVIQQSNGKVPKEQKGKAFVTR